MHHDKISVEVATDQAEPVFQLFCHTSSGEPIELSMAEAIGLSKELGGLVKMCLRSNGNFTGFVGLFLSECYSDSSEYMIRTTELWNAWELWRIQNNNPMISRRQFHKFLRSSAVKYRRTSAGNYVLLESLTDGGAIAIRQDGT